MKIPTPTPLKNTLFIADALSLAYIFPQGITTPDKQSFTSQEK